MSKLNKVKSYLSINKKYKTKTDDGWVPSTVGEYRHDHVEWLIRQVELYQECQADALKLHKRVKELEYHNEVEKRLNKDLHKLHEFLQANPDLLQHRFGESISIIALDALKRLQEENHKLRLQIGREVT